MRLTVVPIDSVVCKNGECLHEIDLSWVPEEVHVVQWYDTEGEIELKSRDPNIPITDLGIYERASELWDAKKKEIEDAIIQAELSRDYWEELRGIRNYKLFECDWTQLPDNNLTEEQRTAWQVYRQQLRDFIDTVTDPKSIVNDPDYSGWPVPPTS